MKTQEIEKSYGTTECTKDPTGLILGKQKIKYRDENVQKIK